RALDGRHDTSHGHDDVHLTLDETVCNFEEAFCMIVRPTLLDRDVAPLDPAKLAQSVDECINPLTVRVAPTYPMVGSLPVWGARAASGHAAAPPMSVMNWRRLVSSMGLPSRNPLCQLTAGSGCPRSARRSLG